MNPAGVTALVSGGASGLGLATATMLAARGARVTVLDRDHAAWARTSATLREQVTFIAGDVVSEADVGRAVAASPGLRVCVSCAGIGTAARVVGREGPFALGEFRRVVDVNLVGTFNVLRLAAAAMAQQDPVDGERGVIVNTASIAAYEGQVGQAAYAASKAGVIGLTLCAARDLASSAVRVVTISPGAFDTPLEASVPAEFRERMVAATPFPRREGRPEEFAALVCHVIENQMLNGETIRLDGGLRLPPR